MLPTQLIAWLPLGMEESGVNVMCTENGEVFIQQKDHVGIVVKARPLTTIERDWLSIVLQQARELSK